MSVPLENKNLAYQLFESIQGSSVEYTYRGSFTTNVTDKILDLTEKNLDNDKVEKKIRKRVFFIIVEGLQNITRHQSSSELEELAGYPGLFVLQYKPDGYYITTGNLIKSADEAHLKKIINEINELNADELKKYSLERLDEGRFSEKGGAGLGLIEIARKSGNKLVYSFNRINKDFTFFYMHSKIIGFKEEKDTDNSKESLKRIIDRHAILEKENILLYFSGTFTQEILLRLLGITEIQLKGTILLKSNVNALMVEILQNIVNHADLYTYNGIKGKHAIFFIKETAESFIFTSGNYIYNDKIKEFTKKLDKVNSQSKEELKIAYNKKLFNKKNKNEKHPGLGLMDIRMKVECPLVYDFYKVKETFSFFTLKIQISKMEGLEKNYIVQEEEGTPEIIFRAKEGTLEFRGKSIPENAVSFYKPIIDWLNLYKEHPAEHTQVAFRFDYYNTATDRQLVKIMLIFEEISKHNSLHVNWFFKTGDISMKNDGEKFQELIDVDISIIENTEKSKNDNA